MARIRSVHPGLFTDEAFASLSNAARVLLIGIWTECDDHGVFEWKPLGLKMRVFPADAVNMEVMTDLMEALVAVGCVKHVEMDGKDYGLVRNFCQWQRPKKPTYKYPLPGHLRSYVGITGAAPPPVENQLPTAPEKAPQRKEGGGSSRREEPTTTTQQVERESPPTIEKPSASPPDSLSGFSDRVLKEAAPRPTAGLKALGTALPENWTPDDELCEDVKREYGMSDEDIRSELLAFHAEHAAKGTYSANWRASFTTWCKRWKEHRAKQAPPRVELTKTIAKRPEERTDAEWDNTVGFYAKTGRWTRDFGPDPMSPACKAPKAILEKHGVDPKTGERQIPPRKEAVSA